MAAALQARVAVTVRSDRGLHCGFSERNVACTAPPVLASSLELGPVSPNWVIALECTTVPRR